MSDRPKSGTREWATHNKNFDLGCHNDCRYCYARYDAVVRFKRKTFENWKNREINMKKFNEKPVKLDGRLMFPSTHDITIENVGLCVEYLKKWLAVGNEILIVSKPHLSCVNILCHELAEYKSQITFRFTICSKNDDVLKFWEPNAPSFNERKEALKYAHLQGYNTSVSCEPYLDEDICLLVEDLLPYISDSIWIGKMNKMKPRVDISNWTREELEYLNRVKRNQTDEIVKAIYDTFKNNPRVKYKESVKRVIGLPEEEIG